MNEEWQEGYKQGIRDGIEIEKNRRDHLVPPPSVGRIEYGERRCDTCGISFTDGLGRLKPMGYVCPHNNCPGKISCNTSQPYNTLWSASMTGSLIKDPGPSDGMSYEEIYGSVIYQQKKNKEE
jgi:hypothetical protein